MMGNLIVVAYPDEYRATEVLASLRRSSNECLIDLEDACYVTKDDRGKLTLHQNSSAAGEGAAWGGMWGLLIGLLFFVPFLGLAIGAGIGALTGKLADYGIDDAFAKQLASTIQPNSSAIFVLTRKVTADKVVPVLAEFGGTILQTSLPKETEAKLQEALSQGAGQRIAQAQEVAEAQAATDTDVPTPISVPRSPIPGVTGNP